MAESSSKARGSKGKAPRSRSETLMALAAKKSSGAEQAAEPSRPAAFIDENSDSLKAFVQANEVILNGMATLNAEMVAFGTKRLRENVERSESLTGCKDPEQAFRVQFNFLEAATQQYLEQANNMMTIMTTFTRDFWAPMQERTSEALRDLNKGTD